MLELTPTLARLYSCSFLFLLRTLCRQVSQGCKETLALPLLGVPLGVKDNLCTAGVQTTAGSRILEGYLPSYDARAVSKLKQAGGIVVKRRKNSGVFARAIFRVLVPACMYILVFLLHFFLCAFVRLFGLSRSPNFGVKRSP